MTNTTMLVPDVFRAYRIVQSLSRAGAARARSWSWAVPACAPDGAAVTAPPAAKRKDAITVRGLRVSNGRRNSMFLRAVRR